MYAVDLFVGCGGLTLGFSNAGFTIKAAYDVWDTAIECYKANFDHLVFKQDLSNVNESVTNIQNFDPDIIVGGPPCQDFSHAGKRKEGTRANLTVSYAEIIKTIKPKWFLLENVDRILKSDAYLAAQEIFKAAGYGLTERVLDASLCGVPQKRRRFFCIGCLGENDGFLNSLIDINLDTKPMTVREYMGVELDVEFYYRHPRNYNRRGVFSVDEPSPTIRGVNRPVPQGYKGHPGDRAPINSDLRALTTLERAQIQTFPKNYIWVGTKTDVEQMVGNAVPVRMAEFIAKLILEYHYTMEDIFMDIKKGFREWLCSEIGLQPRSAGNVISRLKRANNYSEILPDIPEDELIFRLTQSPQFGELSSCVQSQIKRAVRLYLKFILSSKETI